MSDAETEQQEEAGQPASLQDTISREAADLMYHLRCSDAPDDVLEEATGHIRAAMTAMTPWLREGEGWSVLTRAGERAPLDWNLEDLTAVMPYSPVSGKHNPIAPPLRMWQEEGAVRGEALFTPIYAGPPESVHGGIIAAVFDELLSMANVVVGSAGFTGSLTIKYHRKTPLNTPVELWAVNELNEGRKQLSRGEMRVNGEVTASAEGLFILGAEHKKHNFDGPDAS
ncbi:MAG: PaaI family thioesterase [Pseudomonadota bacterium]